MEVGKTIYYAFESFINGGKIKCWVLKKYLFVASVASSLYPTGNNFKIPYNAFTSQDTNATCSNFLLLETRSIPIDVKGVERVKNK